MPVGMARADEPDLNRMLSFGGDSPDRKRASFRVMGAALDPEKVTRITGLAPDEAHRRGDPKRRGNPWREGLWTVSSSLPDGGNHLEDHLRWLLDRLEPKAPALRRMYAEEDLRADFWCFYSMGQANSSLGITPSTLAGIAAIEAELCLDVYGENAETELEHWLQDAEPPR
jgi:Domain of unknown function (DUF4279)